MALFPSITSEYPREDLFYDDLKEGLFSWEFDAILPGGDVPSCLDVGTGRLAIVMELDDSLNFELVTDVVASFAEDYVDYATVIEGFVDKP